MKKVKEKKIVKIIKVDLDKCDGCRACEVACSAFHSSPKYSSDNPARSRIRVIREPLRDVYVPIRAGDYTPAECTGRHTYTINEKEYDECSFCGVSCPARDYFKKPDSSLPLKCDMCESEPDGPSCVRWCLPGALTFEEREVEEEVELEKPDEVEAGLQELVNKLTSPCLFWLDAHYSGGITSKGKSETPIIKELSTICKTHMKHVILIDDARYFGNQDYHEYPSLDSLQNLILKYNQKHQMEVEDDIIRIELL